MSVCVTMNVISELTHIYTKTSQGLNTALGWGKQKKLQGRSVENITRSTSFIHCQEQVHKIYPRANFLPRSTINKKSVTTKNPKANQLNGKIFQGQLIEQKNTCTLLGQVIRGQGRVLSQGQVINSRSVVGGDAKPVNSYY